MRGGEQPGAGAQRDDPAAEDKEPPPPVGPVISQVPRLVAGCVVAVAAPLFATVRIHPPHAKSMQLVTLSTREPRRAYLRAVSASAVSGWGCPLGADRTVVSKPSYAAARRRRVLRRVSSGRPMNPIGRPEGRALAPQRRHTVSSRLGRPQGCYAGRAKRPSGRGSTRPSATRPSRARARWVGSGHAASRRACVTGSRESLRTARRRPRHCLSVPS